MNKSLSFHYLFITLAVVIAGCELEQPREFGDPCHQFSFIWTNGTDVISRDSDIPAEYAVNFQTDMCPKSAPFCIKLLGDRIGDDIVPEELFCSDRRESCPKDSHASPAGCERDTANHCGDTNMNCLDHQKGVNRAECIDGPAGKVCDIKGCLDTFALLDSQCKRGDECCGSYCDNCSQFDPTQYCFSLDALNMECGLECPNYARLICNGVCINPDTNIAFCGSDESCKLHYCAADEGWRNGSCIKGKCEASDCLFGFHLSKDNGRSICKHDTPDVCGKSKLNCLNEIPHATKVNCVLGRCVATECENGYDVYEDTCVEIQGVECGSIHCKPHQKCNPDTLTCECEDGYSDCGGLCYDLKSNAFHCGSCSTECRMAYATSTCENSTCNYNCNKGYEFNEDTHTCEPIEVCEPGKFDCNNDGSLCCNCAGACDISKCNNSVCDPIVECRDSNACATSCCIDNVCVAHSQCGSDIDCGPNAHYYENSCEPDDINNCGVHGHACNVENANNTCENGECRFECNDNFHAFDGACEADDTDNCGAHENACQVADAKNVCNAGECEFTCLNGFVKKADGSGCEASVCSNGDTSCSDQGTTGFYRTCSDNGWGEATPCADGVSCKDEYTCGDCINGTQNCVDKTHYKECSSGLWSTSLKCEAPDNATAICHDEECSYICNSGFCEYGSECVSDQTDMNNCGGCGNVCDKSKVDNSETVSCNAGKCEATKCMNGFDLINGNCVQHICTTNETKCENSRFYTCVNNSWGTGDNCSDGCDSSGCIGHVCSAGDHKCAGNTYYSCSGNSWVTEDNCPHGCDLNGCYDCTPASKQCNGNIPQTCSSSGKWTNGSSCTYGCNTSTGTCYPDCAPGTNNCESNKYYTCSNSGSWDFTMNCPNGCDDSGCYACAPSTKRCNGNISQTCSSSGSWTNGSSCTYGCNPSNGECYPNCAPGSKQCNGNIPQLCDNSGNWTEGLACSTSNQICSAGDCTDCSSNQHVYNNTCEDDSPFHCNSHGSECGLNEICSSGSCTSCGTRYHVYSNTCEINDSSNCGSHGKICTTLDFPNSLSVTCNVNSGQCEVKRCESGYTVDSLTNSCISTCVAQGKVDCGGGTCCQCAAACPGGGHKSITPLVAQCLAVSCSLDP